MSGNSTPRKLWEHPDPQHTKMAEFMRYTNQRRGLDIQTFDELYEWSVGYQSELFWQDIWDFVPVIYEGQPREIMQSGVRMDDVPNWFTGVYLNYAENMLYTRSSESPSIITTIGKEEEKVAVTEVREGCTEIRHVTYGELRRRTGLFASAMRASGVIKGDRVAVVASNSVDTLCVFLAVTSLGGIFSSSSTDMGTRGILDRLTQIKPRFLFMDDAALYNGHKIDLRQKMSDVVKGMEGIKEFQGIIADPRWSKPLDISKVPKTQSLDNFLKKATTDSLEFTRVEFNDPFVIVYSSGTTGQPKCIVHGTGRLIISNKKEGMLHGEIDENTVFLQYTTTGWIMYLSAVRCLMDGARTILYDGSPFKPDAATFVKLLGDQKVSHLGISPRWMQTIVAANIAPRDITDLSALRVVTTTGMVCPESLFNWFYDHGFPQRAQLANITGGTDLAACFGLENPLTPLYCGGCQGPSLGLPRAIYDNTESSEDGPVQGRPLPAGKPGELVSPKPFPTMPVKFWGEDEKAAKKRYFDSYFSRFNNVWTQGDFAEIHPKTGQLMMLGRADGVLNPSGIRFGSSDIYNVVERHFVKEVQDSIVVGQRRPDDDDESVMLFVKMHEGVPLTQDLTQRINKAIATECSKRHVPKYIFETPEIPTTVNLKKVELPVKHIVSGRTVKPSGTLLNPESLDFYYQFAKVEEVVAKHKRASKL